MDPTKDNKHGSVQNDIDLTDADLHVCSSQVMGAATSGAMDGPRRLATLLWFLLTVITIIGGIILLVLGEWFWAVVSIALGCVIHTANLKTASQFIIERAREDRAFLNAAVATGLIVAKGRKRKD